MADDSSCLESIKSKNIALSGSHAGIIKYSQENSLYDKEIELVHIPIVELLPNIYDDIVLYMVTHTEQQFVFQLDFNVRSNNLDICL